jgi:hypothetical protein
MTDVQLYTRIAGLPFNLKAEVSDFVDFLHQKKTKKRLKKRIPGKAAGLITMNENFDEPIDCLKDYM